MENVGKFYYGEIKTESGTTHRYWGKIVSPGRKVQVWINKSVAEITVTFGDLGNDKEIMEAEFFKAYRNAVRIINQNLEGEF